MKLNKNKLRTTLRELGFPEHEAEAVVMYTDRAKFAQHYIHDRWGQPWQPRSYQVESLQSWADRKVHQDGRDVGKTSEIEIIAAWAMICLPNTEMLVCTQRENHLFPLMDRLLRRFEGTPAFAASLQERKRSPSYFLRFSNGFVLWGRIAGPHGINFQGLHVDWQVVDEAQEMTEQAWGELYQALNSGGKRWVYGVPSGLRNSYYRMTLMDDYEQYRWPSTLNPDFSEEKRLELVRLYGGEESQGYVNRVLGLHGSPAHAAFNFEDYQKCVDESAPFWDVKLTREQLDRADFRELVALEVNPCHKLGGYYLGGDLGYARDPSEFVVFADEGGVMRSVGRLQLTGVDYATQVRVILALDDAYGFRGIGIDTGSNGLAVCHDLQSRSGRLQEVVQGYDFGSRIAVGDKPDGSSDLRPAKQFMTQLIESRMRRGAVVFPKCADREEQYISHTYRIGPSGHVVYDKGNDHIIDADRCAFLRQFMDSFPPEAPADPGVEFESFSL